MAKLKVLSQKQPGTSCCKAASMVEIKKKTISHEVNHYNKSWKIFELIYSSVSDLSNINASSKLLHSAAIPLNAK